MPVLNRIQGTRIVSTPQALDAAAFPQDALVLRLASDEVFVMAQKSDSSALRAQESDFLLADPHAIVEPDAGFAGAWVNMPEAMSFLERACEWELPSQRPAFVQGAVAGLAMKLWFEKDRVLFLVPAPYAADLEGRLNGC